VAKSFARIHKANLVNFGVMPLEFSDEEDLARFSLGDMLHIKNVIFTIRGGKPLKLKNVTKGFTIKIILNLPPRLYDILIAGGLLGYIRSEENR